MITVVNSCLLINVLINNSSRSRSAILHLKIDWQIDGYTERCQLVIIKTTVAENIHRKIFKTMMLGWHL